MNNKKKRLYDTTILDPFFDRQLRIPDWNQKSLSSAVCLVLGVGGLGCMVSMNLCRLGVKKVILVDKDKVESHNLNRQILFSKSDIGKSKAKVAHAKLVSEHCICTEVVSVDCDVTEKWSDIVSFFSESTVVFNMIDLGDTWDLVVQSLCSKYQIVHINGGTMQNTITFDFLPPGGPCVLCLNPVKMDEKMKQMLCAENIIKKKVLLIERDETPIGASNVIVATICSNFLVSLFTRYVNGDKSVPNRCIFYLNNYEFLKWVIKKEKKCFFCGDH